MIRQTVHYTGRVQGVGFRWTTARVAKRHPVTGYVQNLPDGRVRLVAEGRPADVAALLDDVQQAMSNNIHHADSHQGEATGEFPDFSVHR